jgi:tryptophan 2,3-dioxygenase
MPAVTANLSQAAFDIWDRIPKKERKSPMGAKGAEGRSAWLSSVIIKNEGWSIRFNELLEEKLELEKALRIWERAYE